MEEIYIEERKLIRGTSLCWDIAHHMYMRQSVDEPIFILAKEPANLLAPLRKQWLKIARSLQKEYAKTLDPTKSYVMKNKMKEMEKFYFKVGPPSRGKEDGLYLLTMNDLTSLQRRCRTLYVVGSKDLESTRQLGDLVLMHGLMVVY